MLIVPAIIPQSFQDIEAKVSLIKSVATRVQVDVIDGVYAPRASWPYNHKDQVAWQKLISQSHGLPFWELVGFEIDMMVCAPEKKIDEWIDAGAETLIIHVESTTALDDIITRAQERGVGLALALKPSTSIERIAPYISRVEFVQCMGSDTIGAQGTSLDTRVPNIIASIHARWPELTIGVDIGVNSSSIALLASAGATRFASGSSVFGSDNPLATMRDLLLRAEQAENKGAK